MTQTATRKQSEIQSAAIFRCVAKQDTILKGHLFKTGSVFYLVNSDSEDTTYAVYYDEHRGCHRCQCPATTQDCKHIRGAVAVAKARQEIQREAREAARNYDVIGEAVKVYNRAVADAQIGSFYEDRAAQMEQQRKDEERARYLNVAMSLGWE